MATITITTDTAARLQLLASAWETSEDGALSRLMDRLTATATDAPAKQGPDGNAGMAVHAVYEGHRVTGRYNSYTHSLTITSAPLDGQTFKSPSGAAIAVVQAFNPRVNPNRNGWSFWTVTATGSTLQSVRGV